MENTRAKLPPNWLCTSRWGAITESRKVFAPCSSKSLAPVPIGSSSVPWQSSQHRNRWPPNERDSERMAILEQSGLARRAMEIWLDRQRTLNSLQVCRRTESKGR
jgi:hypothetical protein